MSATPNLLQAFWRVLIPTAAQAFGSVILSFLIILAIQTPSLLINFGISSQVIADTRSQITSRAEFIAHSPWASNLALIGFWAVVGLVAYLVCWSAYNALIAARNEVALETQYTNRGRWSVPWTMFFKAVSGGGLILYCLVFQAGFSLWLALATGLLTGISFTAALLTLVAILGLAVQLYGLVFFVQLTLTPWYSPKTFTY